MLAEHSLEFFLCFVYICNFVHVIKGQNFGQGEGNSCSTSSGTPGICRLFDNCLDIEALYAGGGQPQICGWTNGDAIVCCPQIATTLPKSEQSKFQILTQVQTQQWVSNKTIIVHIDEKAKNGTVIHATEVHNYIEPVKHVINTNITKINSTDCINCTPAKIEVKQKSDIYTHVSTPPRIDKTVNNIRDIINRHTGDNNVSVQEFN